MTKKPSADETVQIGKSGSAMQVTPQLYFLPKGVRPDWLEYPYTYKELIYYGIDRVLIR